MILLLNFKRFQVLLVMAVVFLSLKTWVAWTGGKRICLVQVSVLSHLTAILRPLLRARYSYYSPQPGESKSALLGRAPRSTSRTAAPAGRVAGVSS